LYSVTILYTVKTHTHTSYVSNILLSSLADSWSIRGLDSCGANKSTSLHNPTNMLLLLLSDFREHREPASEMSMAKRLCAWLLCSFSPRNSDLGWKRTVVQHWSHWSEGTWWKHYIVQHDSLFDPFIYQYQNWIELTWIDIWCWRNFTLFGSKRSSARKRSILTAWNPGFQKGWALQQARSSEPTRSKKRMVL